MNNAPVKVLIAGGGVAALEALMALRELAEERVSLELVTPTPEFAYRPLAVAEPFGLGNVRRYDVVRMAADHGAGVHIGSVKSVDTETRQILTWEGRGLPYDLALIAIGARAATSIPGSVDASGPRLHRPVPSAAARPRGAPRQGCRLRGPAGILMAAAAV